MEIRFDPLNEREAEAVAKFLTPTIRAMIHHETPSDMRDDQWHRETAVVDQDRAAMFGTVKTDQKSMAERHVGTVEPLGDKFYKVPAPYPALIPATVVGTVQAENTSSKFSIPDHDPVLAECAAEMEREQSAAPLPPDAPLPAAADLFATAPAAVPAGQASETPVPPPPAVPAPPQAAAPSAPAAATNPADVDKHGLPWDARIHSGTKAVNSDGSWRQRRGLNDPELVKRVEAELRAMLAVVAHPGHPMPGQDAQLDAAVASSAVPLPLVSGDTTTATAFSETIAAATSVPPPPPVVSATTQDGSTVTPISAPAAAVPPPVVSSVPNVPPPPVVPVPPSSVPATAPIPSPPAVPAPPTVAAPTAPITFADVMRKVTSNIASAKITEAEVHAGLTSIGLAAGEIGKMNGRPELIKAMSDYLDQLLISKAGV